MPATQHDAVLWLSGSEYDVVFDTAREAIAALEPLASVADETSSWPYRHDRDLTGFIDGSENPDLVDAPEVAVIPAGRPGAGGSVLLLQKWSHDVRAWESLAVAEQEQVIGRTKDESVELDDEARRLARRDDRPGRLRQDLPPQHALRHGDRPRDDVRRLQRRAGAGWRRCSRAWRGSPGAVRDALTRYTQPLTGAYYFVPSAQSLRSRGAA